MKNPRFSVWITLIIALLGWGAAVLRAAEDEQAQFKQAQEFEAQKKFAEAEAIYTKLIDANPVEQSLYTRRGWVRHLQKNEQGALADLNLAEMMKPNDPATLFRRGQVHRALEDPEKAVQDFTVVAAADPKNARVRYELAFCLSRSARYPEALTAINEAIALEPNSAAYLKLSTAIHEKLGEGVPALADADLTRTLTGDPKQLEGNAPTATTKSPSAPPLSSSRPKSMSPSQAQAASPATPTGAVVPPESASTVEKLDINALSAGQYNGAVSVAMEGLRLVQAPMSEADTAKFEKQWTPMFGHPHPDNVAYLNKLNPLVQEWLSLRSQLAEASAAYDKAIEEARFAAGYESEAGVRTAMAEAGRHLELLKAGKVHLAELAAQIGQLGDPPDAAVAHHKRKNKHTDALKTARRVAGLPEEDVFLKVDFSRQAEGWSQELSFGAIHEGGSKGGGFRETILPPDQRYAYLHPEDSRLNWRHPRDKPDWFWLQNDPFGYLSFQYYGADLLEMGKIYVKIGLVHAPLAQAEDLGKLETDRLLIAWKQRTFGSINAAARSGYTMFLERKLADESWSGQLKAEYYDVMALDLGDDCWMVAIVSSECSPKKSNDPAGEKIRWSEQQPRLRARVTSRILALIDSLELELVKQVPTTEVQRLDELAEYAKANPLRPVSEADLARLADWRSGDWQLRAGVDPEYPLPQNLQLGNAGYTLFKDDATVFCSTWTPPPARLKPGTLLDIQLTTENRKQDTGFNPGSTYIAQHTAQAKADWGNMAARSARDHTAECETPPANSNPAFGALRTTASMQVPIGSPADLATTCRIKMEFTNGAEPSHFFNKEVGYFYDWVWSIRGDNPSIPPSILPASMSSEPKLPPLTPAEIAKIEAEKKWKKERIAEIRENIAFLSQCLSREQEEHGREHETTRLGSYEFRIIGIQSDIQHEEDLIKSLETGTDVHTRSPFDNYAGAVFKQQCQTEAREASQMVRAVGAANRLAAMLPADEAEKARAFIERQLTPQVVGTHDVKTAREVLNAVNNTVRGHLEGAAAKADLDAASAQLGMDAAENIKYAADNAMSACSLFGGEPINILYQAGTGYAEGGPIQALKNAATTWSDKIDYAVTAYDAYKEGGAAGAAKAVGLKYAQSKAMSYIAGKFMADAGHGSSDTGTLRKPTLQEQFDAAKFQQERGWGEALVKDFERAHLEVKKAGGAGAAPEVIKQLQLAAGDKAAAVASSLHAKNFLKYKADAGLGKAYDAHMRSIHAETDAGLKDRMKQAGWNADEWDFVEFRNSASFGKPNMDRDVGLRERPLWQVDDNGFQKKGADGRPIPNPAAWTTGASGGPVPKPQLTKNGKPMTLDGWREEAQQLYNQAYRKASGGRSAEIALEGVTTSTHPEAYKDLHWLGQDKSLINQAWAGQAADVTRYKALHILNKGDPSAAYFTKLQEVSRGTAKDMESKLMPLLKNAKPIPSTGLRQQATPLTSEAILSAREHWDSIQKVLTAFGKNDMDPITATRRIRELTGGQSISEVVDQMSTLMESLAKGSRR